MQVQRMARVFPPRANCAFALATVRESSAENAKGNAIRINHRGTEEEEEKEREVGRFMIKLS